MWDAHLTESLAGLQNRYILLLPSIRVARWPPSCGAMCSHLGWRKLHQLHGELQTLVLGRSLSYPPQMYTRASASDYDDFQAKGWTTKELIPLMKKHETYQRACNNRDIHGFEGPIKVSFGNYTYPIMQDFLRAVESQGFPITDDLQDLKTG